MHAVVRAIDKLELDKNKVCIVSGIGCSSRAAGYLDFNTIHTTHGRALAFATGIKLAKPELEVVVIAGDGDIAAIGGNHLIHAARRNVGMTVVVINNNIYGMTGGQYSPATPAGEFGTTAPYGNIDRPFDIAALAAGAGASFTARGTVYNPAQITSCIQKGILHKGFSLIECISVCPVYYGRKIKGSVIDMINGSATTHTCWKSGKLPPAELKRKIVTGVLSQATYPEYTEEYAKIIEKVSEVSTMSRHEIMLTGSGGQE